MKTTLNKTMLSIFFFCVGIASVVYQASGKQKLTSQASRVSNVTCGCGACKHCLKGCGRASCQGGASAKANTKCSCGHKSYDHYDLLNGNVLMLAIKLYRTMKIVLNKTVLSIFFFCVGIASVVYQASGKQKLTSRALRVSNVTCG